ncbi:hypothetical protein IQ257_28855 [Coleofasciculus sp. LEGE 07092]|nr:hypothetical protein [Coleofasciculus sp. LEGE 07081]MBE9130091.1 hypothetical protein [Coleofasciculus sp. LEGE 07081]MBE9152417.1 hypothetical protein [Coleofasciculus sp. LEGE 07092]
MVFFDVENFDELAIASELAIEESLAGLDVEEQLSQGLIDFDDLVSNEPIAADYTLDFDEVNTGEEIEF